MRVKKADCLDCKFLLSSQKSAFAMCRHFLLLMAKDLA
ncbi:hypothetical protein RSK20926_06372 [Roseobacter sp. SK209-2-6]|nr:hypothetical protein RSK20926_06372 [Roseobacter sp. SK209-2-6]